MTSARSTIRLRGAIAARRFYGRAMRWRNVVAPKVPLYRWSADRRRFPLVYLRWPSIRTIANGGPTGMRRTTLPSRVEAGEASSRAIVHSRHITHLFRIPYRTHGKPAQSFYQSPLLARRKASTVEKASAAGAGQLAVATSPRHARAEPRDVRLQGAANTSGLRCKNLRALSRDFMPLRPNASRSEWHSAAARLPSRSSAPQRWAMVSVARPAALIDSERSNLLTPRQQLNRRGSRWRSLQERRPVASRSIPVPMGSALRPRARQDANCISSISLRPQANSRGSGWRRPEERRHAASKRIPSPMGSALRPRVLPKVNRPRLFSLHPQPNPRGSEWPAPEKSRHERPACVATSMERAAGRPALVNRSGPGKIRHLSAPIASAEKQAAKASIHSRARIFAPRAAARAITSERRQRAPSTLGAVPRGVKETDLELRDHTHRRAARLVSYRAGGLNLQYRNEHESAPQRGSASSSLAQDQWRTNPSAQRSATAAQAVFSPSREHLAQLREAVRPLVLESLASARIVSSIEKRLDTIHDRRQLIEIERLGGL